MDINLSSPNWVLVTVNAAKVYFISFLAAKFNERFKWARKNLKTTLRNFWPEMILNDPFRFDFTAKAQNECYQELGTWREFSTFMKTSHLFAPFLDIYDVTQLSSLHLNKLVRCNWWHYCQSTDDTTINQLMALPFSNWWHCKSTDGPTVNLLMTLPSINWWPYHLVTDGTVNPLMALLSIYWWHYCQSTDGTTVNQLMALPSIN